MQLIRKRHWFKSAPRPCNKFRLEWARKAWIDMGHGIDGYRVVSTTKRTAFDMTALTGKARADYIKCLRANAYTVHMERRKAERRAADIAQIEAMHSAQDAEFGPERAAIFREMNSLDMANFHDTQNRRDHAALAARFAELSNQQVAA